jgi:serine/threonine protein kinase
VSLQPGASFGGYTIVAKLGEGGMGEVYRATDSRLGRDVAIKVLPDSVATDPDRRARFEREAKALAALNHFNIAQVYGFEGTAIVMELLEGATLRERLANGALPLRKALDFGAQIARGLAAAHERGIIHRDLKPENIFVVNDGQIKILDFGLARQSSELLEATVTGGGTAPGVVMGTAGYMSPEQVRGQAVDTRSDVFALGAVLYEMLTGQRAFRRDSAAETMTAILNDHPSDVSTLRADISPSVDRIVHHCLEKLPAERFQSTRDVAFALEALSGSASSAHSAAAKIPAKNRERLIWAALTAVLAGVALWTALASSRRNETPPLPVTRTQVLLPPEIVLNDTVFPGSRLSISPDSSKIAFAGRNRATGASQLYLIALDSGITTPLAGTKDAAGPIWSPVGDQLVFNDFAGLFRISLAGGTPVSLGAIQSTTRGDWGPDGKILIGGTQLRLVNAQNGEVTVTRTTEGTRFGFPQFLPDGRRYIVGTLVGNAVGGYQIGSLDDDQARPLLSGSDVGNMSIAGEAVVFARGSSIYGQRFDPSRAELSGEPVLLATQVQSAPNRGAAFAVSPGGLLVYQANDRFEPSQLTWIDRAGKVVSTVGEAADYTNIELSADSRRLLASATDEKALTRDILIIDVVRGVRQRFTLDPSDERSAVWSPDQRDVIYTSKGLDLFRRAADLSGDEQPVIVDDASKDPYDWSPDGRMLLYRKTGAGTGNDLWLHPIGGGPDRPVAATRFSEVGGNFSPDGKWIVYVSDESGQFEVYATRVDGGGKIQISSNGGTFPRWRGDGREIVYLGPERMLMSAMVEATAPTLEVSAPKQLFRLDVAAAPGSVYDVTADGSRLIVAVRVPQRVPPGLTVIHNWQELLKPQRARP